MDSPSIFGLASFYGKPLMIFFLLRNAGYPDDPAMHGLIAGLWSSFSGLGRFVSRVGSGLLVDFIGFNYTAAIVTALQLIVVSILHYL